MKGQKIETYGQKAPNFGQIPPIYLYRENMRRPTKTNFYEIKWFYWKKCKIWGILTKSVQCWLFFTKTWFCQNHASTDFFSTMKLGSWNLLQWYLYIVSKNLLSMRIFDFSETYVQNLKISKISEILDIISIIFKIKKFCSMTHQISYRGTTRGKLSFLALFLKKKSVPVWSWENWVFVRNSKYCPDFTKKFLKF